MKITSSFTIAVLAVLGTTIARAEDPYLVAAARFLTLVGAPTDGLVHRANKKAFYPDAVTSDRLIIGFDDQSLEVLLYGLHNDDRALLASMGSGPISTDDDAWTYAEDWARKAGITVGARGTLERSKDSTAEFIVCRFYQHPNGYIAKHGGEVTIEIDADYGVTISMTRSVNVKFDTPNVKLTEADALASFSAAIGKRFGSQLTDAKVDELAYFQNDHVNDELGDTDKPFLSEMHRARVCYRVEGMMTSAKARGLVDAETGKVLSAARYASGLPHPMGSAPQGAANKMSQPPAISTRAAEPQPPSSTKAWPTGQNAIFIAALMAIPVAGIAYWKMRIKRSGDLA